MKHLLLTVLTSFFLASCTNTPATPPVNTGATELVTPITTPNYEETLKKISPDISGQESFSTCMSQYVNMCAQQSAVNTAQTKKDATFCKHLPSKNEQDTCIFAVAIMEAQSENSIEPCGKIPDTNYQIQCKRAIYQQQANTTKDIKICDKILTLQETQSGGIAVMSPMTPTNDRDQCIMGIVQNNGDITESVCKSLSDKQMQDACTMMIKTRREMEAQMPRPAPLPTAPINNGTGVRN